MPEVIPRRRGILSHWLVIALLLAAPAWSSAQPPAQGQGGGGDRGGRGGPSGAGTTGRSAAPVDLTGYWVSIVTEDWIERMSPDSPPSGTGGARGLRGQPAAPPPANSAEPCRAYAAAGSLRVPTRLHITWTDDNTLKIEMDAGTQTRLLHFNPTTPAPAEKTLQGYSVATWEVSGGGGRGGRGGPGAGSGPPPPRWGSLNVATTNMKGGYLLSSRSSYSENATLTEYFTRHSEFGTDYFTVTAVIQDGNTTRATSSTFKKEPDGSKFKPTGCEIVR
jgi:hypothetical protein